MPLARCCARLLMDIQMGVDGSDGGWIGLGWRQHSLMMEREQGGRRQTVQGASQQSQQRRTKQRTTARLSRGRDGTGLECARARQPIYA